MSQNKSKFLYIVISIIAVLATVVLVYLVFFEDKIKPVSEDGPKGFLLLTLKPMVKGAVSSVYMYDLTDGKLRFFDDKGAMNITGHGLPSGVGVTASRPYNLAETEDKNIFQLYRIDMKNYFDKTRITNSRTFLKRHAEWSPDGEKIAFMAKKEIGDNPSSFNPDSWSIYVTDIKGNEKLLGKGAYPQWGPDSKQVVALRSDGLYLYDSEKQEGRKIWEMEGGDASLRMTIDISRDGSKLAWSTPNDNQIILMEISSWEPFKAEIYETINDVFAFWPVFAPEGEYLSAIVGDESEDSVENLYLKIYDLETFEWRDILDLSGFSVTSMALTDWAYHFE